MTVAPIQRLVHTRAAPASAFAIFTGRIGEWWPKGQTPAPKPHVALIIEPHVDGRWFERDADGSETQWGKVLVWTPPHRLVLAWQLNSDFRYDPTLVTEVEITFTPAADGGTDVKLEHRDLQKFSPHIPRMVNSVGGGWTAKVREFAEFADSVGDVQEETYS
jgi:uncharacterized protein YndB with AHSA1/START domain